jgi:hypothetical protein
MKYAIHLFTLVTAIPLCAAPLASIIKVSPKEVAKNTTTTQSVPYKDLACSEEDKQIVEQLITTLASSSKISLLMKQGDLKALGAEISHLHGLKFLTAIFTNPSLKTPMYEIFMDRFKKDGFMGGLTPGLTKEANEGKLMQYASGFSAELKADLDTIKEFFRNQNWEGMVRYLIDL